MKTRRITLLSSLLLAALLSLGCGSDDEESPADAEGNDTGSADAGSADTASVDMGSAGDDTGVPNGTDSGLDSDPGTDTANDVSDAGVDLASVENVAGRHNHMMMLEGVERQFIVYVPEGATGAVEAPVVMMFHGTTGDGERFYNISGWREKADEVGLIAVFPSSLTYCFYDDENRDGDYDDAGERKLTTKWATGKLGDEFPLCTADEIAGLPADRRALVDHALLDDLAFVDAILDVLETEYVIDDTRIYASGFSNGGGFSSRVAAERSNRFAAAAAAAGGLDDEIVTPTERAISFVFSLGEVDDGFTSGLEVETIPMDETVMDIAGMQSLVNRYLTILQLTDDYTYEINGAEGSRVSRFTFSTSTVGADNELQIAVVEGLDHHYPNGNNHPVNIVDPLWTFFSRYSLE